MTLAIDGTPVTGLISGAAASSVVSGALTTTNPNDVIFAFIGTSDSAGGTGPFTVSSVSGGGLTWTRRGGTNVLGADFVRADYELWWAPSPGTFSGTITANLSGAAPAAIIIAFALSGANIAAPFDTNNTSPIITSNLTGTSLAPTASISTANANTVLFGSVLCFDGSETTWTDQSGFSTFANPSGFSGSPNFVQLYAQCEGLLVSSPQSGAAVGFTPNTSEWIMIVDAIQAAGGGGLVVPVRPPIVFPALPFAMV